MSLINTNGKPNRRQQRADLCTQFPMSDPVQAKRNTMSPLYAPMLAIEIQNLPLEIIVKLFLLLPARSMLTLRSTCQYLAIIFHSSSAIQYHLKLSVWGMTEFPRPTECSSGPAHNLLPSYAERLALLDNRIALFSSLQWTESQFHTTLDISSTTLVGDQLCLGSNPLQPPNSTSTSSPPWSEAPPSLDCCIPESFQSWLKIWW